MNRILGVLGLRLSVCRISAPPLDRDCSGAHASRRQTKPWSLIWRL